MAQEAWRKHLETLPARLRVSAIRLGWVPTSYTTPTPPWALLTLLMALSARLAALYLWVTLRLETECLQEDTIHKKPLVQPPVPWLSGLQGPLPGGQTLGTLRGSCQAPPLQSLVLQQEGPKASISIHVPEWPGGSLIS